jgi:hypothetical protein
MAAKAAGMKQHNSLILRAYFKILKKKFLGTVRASNFLWMTFSLKDA